MIPTYVYICINIYCLLLFKTGKRTMCMTVWSPGHFLPGVLYVSRDGVDQGGVVRPAAGPAAQQAATAVHPCT
jgi:hypothetical protein